MTRPSPAGAKASGPLIGLGLAAGDAAHQRCGSSERAQQQLRRVYLCALWRCSNITLSVSLSTFCGDWRVMAAPAPGDARPPKPPSYVKRSAGWRDCTRTVSASGAEESSLAAGHYVIKRRFQFKRAQRYIRSQLFPTTFE